MIYLIFGADSFRGREFINSLAANQKLKFISLAEEIPAALNGLSQSALFGPIEIPVFRNLLNELKPHLENLSNTKSTAVIWQEQEKLTVPSQLKNNAQVKEFPALSPGETKNWIRQTSRLKGFELDQTLINQLVQAHGANLAALTNELTKIELYLMTKPGAKLTSTEFDRLCSPTLNGNVFNFTDAIGERSQTRALREFELLAGPGQDEWYLFFLIAKHLRQLLRAKHNYVSGLHPFVQQKLTTQSKNWSIICLQQNLNKLLQVENEVKQGLINLKPALVNWILTTV